MRFLKKVVAVCNDIGYNQVMKCKNKKCRKIVVKIVPWKKYCSTRCRVAGFRAK